MRLTTKRGKRPAKVELFEVDKRRMGEVTEIFNTVAVTTVGEQATLAKAASEAITAALAAIERAGLPPKAMEEQLALPLGDGTAGETGEDEPEKAEASPPEAPAAKKRTRNSSAAE